jgi:DNA-binding NarL/FixJ family response regulator
MRVYIVDDHPVVREGLGALLASDPHIEVVGHAGSGEVALCELRRIDADVVVVDDVLDGSGIDSLQLIQKLRAAPYSLRCLVLTSSDNAFELRAFLEAGAISAVSKSVETAVIVRAVAVTGDGQPFFDHRVLQALVNRPAEPSVPNTAFDLRDRAILRSLAEGRSNREIAAMLCVSPSSAKKYVSSLLRKLGVSHRTSAIAAAAERGLLDVVRGVPTMSTPIDEPRKSGQLGTQLVASWD